MQYKQNSLKRVFTAKRLLVKTIAGILVAAILPIAGTAQVAFAAGSASLSLTSSTGTHKVGGTITLTIHATTQAGDNADAVQANLSYPSSKLKCSNSDITVGSAFDVYLPKTVTCGSGSISIGVATSSTLSGTQTVATVTLHVLAAGSASVSVASSSDIVNATTSVWNGSTPSASYTLTSTTTGGSTAKKTTPAPTTAKTGTAPSSSKTTTTPNKAITNPSTPQTPATQSAATTPAATAALTITVTDSNGKPVKGAKVSVDDQYTAYTTANGKASLSGIAVGSHTVSVTASGKTATKTTLNLTANEDKQVSLKLAAKQSLMPAVYVVIGLLVLGGGSVAFLKMRGGGIHGPQTPVSGIVVGSGTPPPAPTAHPATIQPAGSQPTSPQVITSNQPPANPSATDGTPRVQ